MTVNELIRALVDHVQAGRCQPTSEVVSPDGFVLKPRACLGMVLMENEPRLTLAVEPNELCPTCHGTTYTDILKSQICLDCGGFGTVYRGGKGQSALNVKRVEPDARD